MCVAEAGTLLRNAWTFNSPKRPTYQGLERRKNKTLGTYYNNLVFPTFLRAFFTEIVRLLMSMQVDRVDRRKIYWSGNYINPNSNEYRLLENEANYAVSSKSEHDQLAHFNDERKGVLEENK